VTGPIDKTETLIASGEMTRASGARMLATLEARRETLSAMENRPAVPHYEPAGHTFAEHWASLPTGSGTRSCWTTRCARPRGYRTRSSRYSPLLVPEQSASGAIEPETLSPLGKFTPEQTAPCTAIAAISASTFE